MGLDSTTVNCSVKTVLGKQSINEANSIPRKLPWQWGFFEHVAVVDLLSTVQAG